MKHIVIDARIRRASTGRYVDRLIEHLQKIDKKNLYSILVQPDDPWKPTATNFARVGCPYPQFSFNPAHQFGFARQLYGLKADLVNFPMNQQPLFYFKPVVTATMDLTMLRFTRAGRHSDLYHAIRMAGYRFLFWYSLKKSKAIITISNFVKSDIEQHYPFAKGRITVTYCASEPPLRAKATMPKFSSKFHEPGSKLQFLLHVGSPFPHKNIERLLDAFVILKNTHPNLRLVLAGKKEFYFEKLEKATKDNRFANDVAFTGFVSDEELKWLYENAKAYVLPSLSEGFGLPGLEAMTHGCPVVSSNATCLPEVYGNAVRYFDPNNTEDMAEKIDNVISDDKLRKELVKKGFLQLEKYSWQRMAKQTLEVFNKIL